MRKIPIIWIPQDAPPSDQVWMDVEQIASVGVSSEENGYPFESALSLDGKIGWRAANPGMQTIRLVFDEPQKLRRISPVFEDAENSRTQEFVLRWSSHIDGPLREIIRQQWNFNPPDSVRETEDYRVELSEVKVFELKILPDKSGGEVRASLVSLRLA